MPADGWYWLSTRTACGGVLVRAGVITGGCLYYRQAFAGRLLTSVPGRWERI